MAASRRAAAGAPPIPRYALYDEPARRADPRFIHVETIASRSAPRDWTIRSHAHHDLHQVLTIVDGGGVMRAEAEQWRFGAASLLIAPAGLVHGFRFESGTRGHIMSFADALARPAMGAEPDLSGLLSSARVVWGGKAAITIDRLLARLAGELAGGRALTGLASGALLSLVLVEAARALGKGVGAASVAPGREAALVARFRAQIEARLGDGWPVAQHALAFGGFGIALARGLRDGGRAGADPYDPRSYDDRGTAAIGAWLGAGQRDRLCAGLCRSGLFFTLVRGAGRAAAGGISARDGAAIARPQVKAPRGPFPG